MNLHSVAFKMGNVAIWLQGWGGNGRGMGVHLWEVEEGTPSTQQDEARSYNRNYWRPRRFTFQPFSFDNIMERDGRYRQWVPPLCGYRSASRRARLSNTGYHGTCQGCLAAAARRGIVPLTYTEAQDMSPLRTALQQEERDWELAGRPSPWPPSPSET
jgi:hypothetical protein